MSLEEVKQILLKYQKEENRINELLQQNDSLKEKQSNKKAHEHKNNYLSVEDVIKRNRSILKELETVKGNLRSKAIYSPCEMQWDIICKRYQAAPSLPVTSWRCHVHVFV
ncbi:hypothetical protein ILUMI_27431 [Ignelater luminosus]|uniref:Uncharacterized protein n=1 Tax=Ignelater luminosus TaxID=2038154 RepID=A0A8K0C6J1_IGNLU|nr:hypothetical protein ILUMI_27431 [Ignelater luminosus]